MDPYEMHHKQDCQGEAAVNHPPHYSSHPSGVECITVAEHMTFCVGNAIKYLWRAGLKGGQPQLQDLQKARWYVDREIARLSGATAASPSPPAAAPRVIRQGFSE